MKSLFVVGIFSMFSSLASAQLQSVPLQSGQSVIIGQYQVVCGGVASTRQFKCKAGMNGPSFSSDWMTDVEDAREQAMDRCTRARSAGCGATSCRQSQ